MEWTTVHRRKSLKIVEDSEKNTGHSINPISLQILIRSRLEKDLNQEESDNLCAFPRNTFKNIESNRMIPTEEQKRRIQQHFNTYLKTDIMND